MNRWLMVGSLAMTICGYVSAQGLALGHSKDVDPASKKPAARVTTQLAIPESPTPIIRVYKDFNAWSGSGRDNASLSALGKTQGTDWFVHPVADCATGIPAGTTVVYFTANSYGDASTTAAQRDPACQAALANFLSGGGKLVVDMGDNDVASGFLAPGSAGTPNYLFPFDSDVSPTSEAVGPDLLAGTADDHPFLKGPDNIPGTADDVTDTNSDNCCYSSHGNLSQGITLPAGAKSLLFARFNSTPVEQPILAEYCQGPGRVLVNTMTNGWPAWQPSGDGPAYAQTSLLAYALSPESNCAWPFTGFFAPVDNPPVLNSMKAGSSVPMKFSVGGYRGLDIIAAGYPTVSAVTCDAGALVGTVDEAGTAGSSSISYDASQDQYVYVWKTEKSWANSCRSFALKLKDGSTHTAVFRMGK